MKPEDVAYSFTLDWKGMRKLIGIADRAGCEPGRAVSKALVLFEIAAKAVERGGRVVVIAADGEETEITGLIGEGEAP